MPQPEPVQLHRGHPFQIFWQPFRKSIKHLDLATRQRHHPLELPVGLGGAERVDQALLAVVLVRVQLVQAQEGLAEEISALYVVLQINVLLLQQLWEISFSCLRHPPPSHPPGEGALCLQGEGGCLVQLVLDGVVPLLQLLLPNPGEGREKRLRPPPVLRKEGGKGVGLAQLG